MSCKRASVAGLVVLASLFLAPRAHADAILAPGATWEYTFTNPTGDAGWSTGSGSLGSTGLAPFGNTSGGDFGANTLWAADGSDGDDLWVRRKFDTTGFDATTIAWDLGVDNGYKLYVDGFFVAGDNAEGFTVRWEYSGSLAYLALAPGEHWVAVALEDHGGATAFDMEITGTPTAVPEPGALTLMGLGLGLAALAARRNKA